MMPLTAPPMESPKCTLCSVERSNVIIQSLSHSLLPISLLLISPNPCPSIKGMSNISKTSPTQPIELKYSVSLPFQTKFIVLYESLPPMSCELAATFVIALFSVRRCFAKSNFEPKFALVLKTATWFWSAITLDFSKCLICNQIFADIDIKHIAAKNWKTSNAYRSLRPDAECP